MNKNINNKMRKEIKFFMTHCYICGYNTHIDCLEIHHIIPISNGGSDLLDNITVICANCHRLVHKGVILAFNTDSIVNKSKNPTEVVIKRKRERILNGKIRYGTRGKSPFKSKSGKNQYSSYDKK